MATRDYVYKDKQYSVTALLDSVRAVILKRRHDDEIEEDVSDLIFALFGTAAHSVLEHAGTADDELSEDKIVVELDNGYKMSAIFDLYSEGDELVTDFKTTSVWSVIYGETEKWRKQLLMYAWALRKIGFECNNGRIIAIMRDWQKSKARFTAGYPRQQVQTFNFKFTDKDFEEIEAFIYSRFAEIIEAESLTDDALPVCTPDERFQKPDSFAVMKKGRKTALRVLPTEEDAKAYMDEKSGDYIEKRASQPTKCISYCSCCDFCNYYKENVVGKYEN